MLTNFFSHDDIVAFFEQAVFIATGKHFNIDEYVFTGGGCIHQAIKLTAGDNTFFLKWNENNAADMFACEEKGLELLRKHSSFKIPEVIGRGSVNDKDFLLLEYLPQHREDSRYWAALGLKLAELHRVKNANFGLEYDNFIGSLPQYNQQHASGVSFFIHQRLMPTAGMAYYNELFTLDEYRLFEVFYAKLPELIPEEAPSLLHGDLWSGNIMALQHSEPAIFDPAVYFGLREAELAFTQLFGGFDPIFLHTYHEAYPLESGFKERIAIYNLYPLLVHLILFGQSYKDSILNTIRKYV
jgi:fructosamine-3-kinase